MAKQDNMPIYPCMAPPGDARKVEHPHEERIVATKKPRRRILTRFVSTLRR
jgi:hypothetical protein